jgi:hypothetical protein
MNVIFLSGVILINVKTKDFSLISLSSYSKLVTVFFKKQFIPHIQCCGPWHFT